MTKSIKLGSIEIPVLDYAVSCNAILGIRDSGKTVTAKGIAEQLIEADIPIVVFDAVGKWRWMKVAAEGPRGKGYKVVVVGGRAPDLALTPHSVGEIVRSAIRERIPLIIDLYDPKLSKADWRRIVQQSIQIIHYEANGVSHVFLEEAAEFIPQKVMDGATYAEVEKLARMGGNASVGITIINQRSQEVNKAVLDLSHNLILGCQIGNKAIEAVEKWVDRLAPDVAKAVTSSLPKLTSGEAWVWTRSHPDEPKREKLPMCRSLHPDRRTPEVVLKSAKPTDINQFVDRLSASIPKIIEEAKNNDPAVLRQRIRELERAKPVAPAAKHIEIEKRVEVPILEPYQSAHLAELLSEATNIVNAVKELNAEIRAKTISIPPIRPITPILVPRPATPRPITAGQGADSNPGQLTGTQQRILNTVVMLCARGLTPNRDMIARWQGLHPTGNRYTGDLARLRDQNLLNGCELTNEGLALTTRPQTGFDEVKQVVDGTKGRILETLLGGETFTRDSLAATLGLHPTGNRYTGDLAWLRTMGLIPERGEIKLLEAALL